ncbi:MAG: dethiobiotin synthase [Planctomycetes bacterium]|nr:dethiobiotin synthase [Planctomycetota bacterium]
MTRARLVVLAGTDTGVGKTVVGLGLALAARRAGLRCIAIKPIESGCVDSPDEDGRRLARMTGQPEPAQALQRFGAAISPWLAAEREAARPDPELWLGRIEDAREDADLVLVEGAGGLLSPLAEGWDLRRLAIATGAEVLLVAPDRLGSQHAILATLEALDGRGLAPARLLLGPAEGASRAELGNREILRRVRPALEVVDLPRVSGDDEAALAPLATALRHLVETGP